MPAKPENAESVPSPSDRPLTSTEWCHYFVGNARSLLPIPWGEHGITAAERRAIARSIRGFQAGESSEGRHLLRHAREYAERTGDYNYVEAIRLFIREEQRHARDLARFCALNGIALQRTNLPDRVFRRLRNLFGGLEVSICVLLTAEIVALVYYAALRDATGSGALRRLCEQILRDEVRHVEFQATRIGKLRAGRSRALRRVACALQRVLFSGTCLVVWAFHRQVLLRGGLALADFLRLAHRELRAALALTAAVADR